MKRILKVPVQDVKSRVMAIANSILLKVRRRRLLRTLSTCNSRDIFHILKAYGYAYKKMYDGHYVLLNVKDTELCRRLEQITGVHWFCVLSSATSDVSAATHLLMDEYLAFAMQLGASDVFITDDRCDSMVQYQKHGRLLKTQKLSQCQAHLLLQQLCMFAHFSVQQSVHQDGHLHYYGNGQWIFGRLAHLMHPNGVQTLSLRLFDPHRCACDLSSLQVPEPLQAFLKNTVCHWRFGCILISGPTGSGKTSTLYALGQLLRRQSRKLIAFEDPVEMETDQWVQIPINDAIGYTFDVAFRGIIQQDVEVLLIGEIRDRETARVAFEASLAGYLVIATIHADALDLVPFRCQELGIDAGEFLNAVRLQIHQVWDQRTADPHPHFTWEVRGMKEPISTCN